MIGPQTEFGRTMHAMKYRAPEETFDDYCVRYTRTTADNEGHFRRLLRYLREQVLLPAGRQQLAVGRPYQTTAFNCLQGDTEILTAKGYVRLRDIAGKTILALSPISGEFEIANVKSYGVQPLNRITISNSRHGQTRQGSFTVEATPSHRWVLQDGSVTDDLRAGYILKAASAAIELDEAGWVHGFIYGDGTKIRDAVEGAPRSNPAFTEEYPFKKFAVRLCGDKTIHLNRILEAMPRSRTTYPPSQRGEPLVWIFSEEELKELPIGKEMEYVAGFVEGLLAADGCFASRGNDPFQFHGDEKTVRWMRDHMILANYAPCGKCREVGAKDEETNYGARTRSLWMQPFRRSTDHKGFKVLSIQSIGKAEVYCAEEPKHRQLVLRNGLSTGNCFVGSTIADDTAGIFEAVKRGAMTLRSGGGVGWDFSTLRPSGEPIRGLGHGALASGPISFMKVWDSMCSTIMSAGERRGAMMGVLRVDHPDVMKFVRAKADEVTLRNFNISVAVTDEFMEALLADGSYELRFGGTNFGKVRAADVWAAIMENNWDFAEPGVLFIDRINRLNPLRYCETIAATNPCAEQPLPPDGACLLGSINGAKLLIPAHEADGPSLAAANGKQTVRYVLDTGMLVDAVDAAVRAFDNVIDRTTYPLPEQQHEARQKRRMGIGVTGLANALEVMGYPYASAGYLGMQDKILEMILHQAYRTSAALAREKGPFPLWDAEKYCAGEFFRTRLPEDLQAEIRATGLRNGLLTSIAPTGTISMAADNVSSGIEPVFALRGERLVLTPQGQKSFQVIDHALEAYGVEGRTADIVSAEEHIDVLCRAQRYVDSSISKTCNVFGQIGGQGKGVPYADFKQLYLRAWEGGAKSCTTFNLNGKRRGILKSADPDDGAACTIDPATGAKSCEV